VRPLARESVWLCLSCGTRFRLAEARRETGAREPMLAGWRRLPKLMPGAGRNRFSGGVGVSAAAEATAQSGASSMFTPL
jgi:hypothetical protein